MLFKAMVLNSTMEEMVEEGKNSSITYSNDGSLITSVGLLVVLSFTINGVQHALPTMSIFTESRQLQRLGDNNFENVICSNRPQVLRT